MPVSSPYHVVKRRPHQLDVTAAAAPGVDSRLIHGSGVLDEDGDVR
jgi:hypothetical protein